MRYVKLVPLLLLLFPACSIKKGDFDGRILRLETEEGHASIERVKGTGSQLKVVSDTGFPEWWLGNFDHTQIFLPLLKCTTYYTETGEKERTECEQVSPVDVENNLRAKDGTLGDRITTGTATEYGSSFEQELVDSTPMWIEFAKSAVERAEISKEEKDNQLKFLNDLANILTGGGDQ